MLARTASSLLLSLIMSAACGADDSGEAGDAGPNTDGGSDGAVNCTLPATDVSWLEETQNLDLMRLTGEMPTPAGVILQERSTLTQRGATQTFLQTRLSELGYAPQLDLYRSTGGNVYAELEATSPTNKTIVLGAHFDSVPQSPGANDNATGVAMLLAAARYAKAIPCRSHNLLFVFFDEEEIGLIGSDYFAQLLSRPEFGAEVVAVHTVDQNGWDDDGDLAFELERADGDLLLWYSQAKEAEGATMPIHPTNTGSTDHVSFRKYGFSAIGITEEFVNQDTTPHYHLPSDTYETVNRPYLASTTRIVFRMLAQAIGLPDTSARQLERRPSLSERLRAATREPRLAPPPRRSGCRGQTVHH